jgi:ubiquinone/menaquinone biosynthesis C-methylase UbiE
MQISTDNEQITCTESDIYNSIINLDDSRILDLGCGAGPYMIDIATTGSNRTVVGMEVDEVQYRENVEGHWPPNISFVPGGAQNIPADDASFDVVMMFKSLHHVPLGLMGVALGEIHRVLKPGGFAYISEPVFAGDFNQVLRIFHNEERARKAAFDAIVGAVEAGDFVSLSQVFFNTYGHYSNFEEFQTYVMNRTYLDIKPDAEIVEKTRAKFTEYMSDDGAHFLNPNRVDLLQKPEG